jgi:hypothetical protein
MWQLNENKGAQEHYYTNCSRILISQLRYELKMNTINKKGKYLIASLIGS